MKFIDPYYDGGMPTVELTERNLNALLAKLPDPASKVTLIDGERRVIVVAVPDSDHYSDREPGPVLLPIDDGVKEGERVHVVFQATVMRVNGPNLKLDTSIPGYEGQWINVWSSDPAVSVNHIR